MSMRSFLPRNAEACESDHHEDTPDRIHNFLWEEEPWINRKVYIVENGGRPSEVFCTDYLQNARHVSLQRNDRGDKRRLLRIMDRWREDWTNKGVQVPLSLTRQTYHFESVTLFSELELPECQLPKKLVAHNEKVYTLNNRIKIEFLPRSQNYRYLIDNADEDWLGTHKWLIDIHTFVMVMDQLEVTAYKNMHTTLLECLKNTVKRQSEEDAICQICCMPESDPDDQIVFCDGENCNVSVHQSCYGIIAIPSDDWFCALCESGRNPKQRCIFCPIYGGAMKAVKHLDEWAHVACALWIPEVRFGDVNRMEPITHINEIPAERRQHKCFICDTSNGVCIKCQEIECDTMYHVTCALYAGYALKIENDSYEVNGVRMWSFCQKHSQNRFIVGRNNITQISNHFSDIKKNFAKFVDLEEISDKFIIDPQTVHTIFEYWKAKRIHNGYNLLISDPVDIRLDNGESTDQICNNDTNKKKTSRKRPHTPSPYDSFPFPLVRKEYEEIRLLRLGLEKARNLCYMIIRREKLKKSNVMLYRQNLSFSAELLQNQRHPISKRRLEKLVSLLSLSVNENIESTTLNDDHMDNDIKNEPPDEISEEPFFDLSIPTSSKYSMQYETKTKNFEDSDDEDVKYVIDANMVDEVMLGGNKRFCRSRTTSYC